MDPLAALIVVVLLGAVVAFLGAPLRSGSHDELDEDAGRLADLEAEKEAKYREIRDAELDRSTGKLAEADWRAIDRQLRGEAVAILREIDRLGGEPTAATAHPE